ncbi:MAG: hypothetical protein LC109_07120 [Bacteroidia bacterium]|nr:hypothetical protein [Bacteroidia bacterium]MCO5254478.1 hypothetical protein [Bacteroidota bacterium]MCZ2130024.1 hypothetical protein [Bacteroidia bacterium]
MTKSFLTFMSIAIVLIACSQPGYKNSESKAGADWKTVEDSTFTVQYPPDWELNNTGAMSTSFVLFAPPETSNQIFRTNINLMVEDLSDIEIDLEQYVQASEEQIQSLITNAKILNSKRQKSDNDEFHQLEFTAEQGEYHLWFEQQYRIKNNKAYVLTFTCEEATYKQYKEAGEAILSTFILR